MYITNLSLFFNQTFVELEGLSGKASFSQLIEDASKCLDQNEIFLRKALFGTNVITVKVLDLLSFKNAQTNQIFGSFVESPCQKKHPRHRSKWNGECHILVCCAF